ncbi:hypothetical protein ACFXAF_01995 [Kitasatospora sp. NPDC059463]|uniref:hypothetical protein n=1 Tax=unclassified Kitasatospora TaxID=2633591 RepID=UPI0036B54159
MGTGEGLAGRVRQDWPSVELDAVRRLRVLAAAGGHRMFAERTLTASFDAVWSVASDLEGELPGLITGLRAFSLEPAESGGDRWSGVATSRIGHRERFDVVLRPGWCLMQSKAVVGGMAAVPEGDGVRFALFGGLRLPGIRAVGSFLGSSPDWKGRVLMDRLESRVSAKAALPPAD